MFDKWKENWRNNKIQQHVQNNRNAYIAGGSGLAVGALGVLILTRAPMQITNNVAPVISPVFNNVVNNVGHCTKIVQGLDDDGQLWPKIGALAAEIAQEHGISYDTARTMVSKHLNGHSHDVFGKRYVTYGLGTTG